MTVLVMFSIRHISSFHIRKRTGCFRLDKYMKRSRGMTTLEVKLRNLDQFGIGTNTLTKYLIGDEVELKSGKDVFPLQLRKKHFINVLPEPVSNPNFIAASTSCAKELELDPTEFKTEKFVDAFSGNKLLPGLDIPYATVYGCHCYGQWFGQLGDGRALSVGEVHTTQPIDEDFYRRRFAEKPPSEERVRDAYGDHVYELQLKGCGRSPFSRGFDGRAVLRSSVREFLGKFVCICLRQT